MASLQAVFAMAVTNPARLSQRGLSLIELMVALAIGVILLLGLVQIFGASRAAFGAAEGLSRVQEGGRFVAETMRSELRMAGHIGRSNEAAILGQPGTNFQPSGAFFNHTSNISTNPAGAPYAFRLDVPIQGYDYTAQATAPNSLYVLGQPAVSGVNGAFSPPLPGALAPVTAEAVVGSDIVVVRYLSAATIPLAGGGAAGSVFVNPTFAGFVQENLLYGVSEYGAVTLFQARSGADPTTGFVNAGPGGRNISTNGWSGLENYGAGSLTAMHQYLMSVYYVGIDVSGEPALFRRTVNPAAPAPHLGAREALVEGVESMQLVFGADNAPVMADVPRIYQTAGQINSNGALGANEDARWRRVLSVRVGLLVRSPQAASDQSVADRQVRVADTVVQLPADGRVRQAYETLVVLRNRMGR
jgi:type IV pilus assembly protein PilW